MQPIGLTPTYEFTLRIEKNGDTILHTAIGTRHDNAEIEKAVATLHDLLEEYRPPVSAGTQTLGPGQTVTIPAPPPEVAEVIKDVAAAVGAIPPEMRDAPYKPGTLKPSGVTGVLHIECPECGRLFGAFAKEPITEIACNCGHVIRLEQDALAKFEYDCPYCEKHRWGLTNREDPEIEVSCVCKSRVTLTWDTKGKIYKN